MENSHIKTILWNVEDDILIDVFYTETQLIETIRKISIENEDFDFSIIGISDAIEYIKEYSPNLKLIEINTK